VINENNAGAMELDSAAFDGMDAGLNKDAKITGEHVDVGDLNAMAE